MGTNFDFFIDHDLNYSTNWDLYQQIKKRFGNVHDSCIENPLEYWNFRTIALETYPEKDVTAEEKVWKLLHNRECLEKQYIKQMYKDWDGFDGDCLDEYIKKTLEAFSSLKKEHIIGLEYDHTHGVLYTQTNSEETCNGTRNLVFEYEKEGRYIEIDFFRHFCHIFFLEDSEIDKKYEWPSFEHYVIGLGEDLDLLQADMKFIYDSLKDICNPSIYLITGENYYCSEVKDLIYEDTAQAVLASPHCLFVTEDTVGKGLSTDLPVVFLHKWKNKGI